MAEITSETRWWVVTTTGHAACNVFSHEAEAQALRTDLPHLDLGLIQVRPVLERDVSEFRRGVEAARDVVDCHFVEVGYGHMLRNVIVAALDRIDKLLADNPEGTEHGKEEKQGSRT